MAVETKIETQLRGGGEKIAELPAEIITYGERLNRSGSISFQLAMSHPTCRRDVVGPGIHEVVITRNRQVVWCGPVWTADEPPKPEDGPHLMEFEGEGLWSYTQKWHIGSTVNFDADDQFAIARSLLAHQGRAAAFGIDTSGSSESGVARDRTYLSHEAKNIGAAVEELAEVENGFDFDIDPATRLFRPYYPRRGSRKPDLIWDERTIRSFHRTIDAKPQASQVLGFGAGEGDAMVRQTVQDSSAVSAFGPTQKPYTNKDVSVSATLLAHIQRELALFKNPAEMLAITVDTDEPEVFSYQVGDEGQVRWPSTYDPVNRFQRLVGRDIIWSAGEEQAVLYLGEVAV